MSESARKCRPFQLACLLLALATPGAAACKDAIERVAGGDRVELPKLAPPDDAGADRFAEELLQAARSGNSELVAALVDTDRLAERATLGLELPPDAVQRLLRQLVNAAKGLGIFSVLAESAMQRGGVRYLAARSKLGGGERWAVFRVAQPSGAFDHCSFLLTRRPDGKVRAVDWHLLTLGESVSSTMRRLLLPAQGDRLRALEAALSPEEATLLRHAQQVTEMQQATQAGDSRRALAIFRSMPVQAQRLKLVLLTRIDAARTLGEQEYRAALQALLEQHPSDPVALLRGIELYNMQGDHEQALQALARLSERAGPDPYFHVLRATTLLQMKDVAGARSAALQALQEEPELDVARFTLVTIALRSKDWTETARWIGELDAHGAVNLPSLRTAPGFAEFAASKAYTALSASARAQAPAPSSTAKP